MSATDYTSLDPSLLTPAQRIMREMQLHEQANPQTQFNLPPDDLENGSAGALISLANTLKTEFDLPPKYCAWADRYVNSSEPERMLILVMLSLNTAKLMEHNVKSEQYTISDGLKKTLRNYSMIFLLCAHLSSYRGPIADAIINALREIGHEEIPRAHEISKLDTVCRVVNDYLTQDRYNIKKKIKCSIKPDVPTQNIAILALKLVSKFNIPITVELLSHLAVLRWSLNDCPNVADEDFWLTADKNIAEWRGTGGLKNPNTLAMWRMFQYIYNEDTQVQPLKSDKGRKRSRADNDDNIESGSGGGSGDGDCDSELGGDN
ncbi:hypothetical protein BDP27DRAFT_1362629 [Rhodocollybia butyracea]|uniref:Uncharacterized protein n=1 Tax=Rhodocollybia butyracea TaxID=206335 RepID=A0A9P5U8W1_9AGAR|nr:hypothetical protein BDP27DRAFT_1362629 [Rhodocollybia butyracea]